MKPTLIDTNKPKFIPMLLLLCSVSFGLTLACEPTPSPREAHTADSGEPVKEASPHEILSPKETMKDSSEQTKETEQPKEVAREPKPLKQYPLDDQLRLNHIQVKGTHNSYHIDPGQGVAEWRYTHQPLDVQLEKLGVRQFELDIYWNTAERKFLVHHIPLLDPKTTCPTFVKCLEVIKKWSDFNPQHLPVFIMIEPKSTGSLETLDALTKLEKEALSVFPKDRIITPDDVRGNHSSLKEAVGKEGWPTLGKSRGKITFFLLMRGDKRTAYTYGDKHLKGRLMFVTANLDSPYCAVASLDDPIGGKEKILKAIKQGVMVRTRADTGLEQAKTNDKTRFEAALASGAHMLSTDFPGPVKGTQYVVEIPGGSPARCNPMTAPANCTNKALEDQ